MCRHPAGSIHTLFSPLRKHLHTTEGLCINLIVPSFALDRPLTRSGRDLQDHEQGHPLGTRQSSARSEKQDMLQNYPGLNRGWGLTGANKAGLMTFAKSILTQCSMKRAYDLPISTLPAEEWPSGENSDVCGVENCCSRKHAISNESVITRSLPSSCRTISVYTRKSSSLSLQYTDMRLKQVCTCWYRDF